MAKARPTRPTAPVGYQRRFHMRSREPIVSSAVSRKAVVEALNQSRGHRGKAARSLGIARSHLYGLLASYDVRLRTVAY